MLRSGTILEPLHKFFRRVYPTPTKGLWADVRPALWHFCLSYLLPGFCVIPNSFSLLLKLIIDVHQLWQTWAGFKLVTPRSVFLWMTSIFSTGRHRGERGSGEPPHDAGRQRDCFLSWGRRQRWRRRWQSNWWESLFYQNFDPYFPNTCTQLANRCSN